MNLSCVVVFHKQSTLLQTFGCRPVSKGTRYHNGNAVKPSPRLFASQATAQQEDKFQAKSRPQLQKPGAAEQNNQPTSLAFFRPDVTAGTSARLAVPFTHRAWLLWVTASGWKSFPCLLTCCLCVCWTRTQREHCLHAGGHGLVAQTRRECPFFADFQKTLLI